VRRWTAFAYGEEPWSQYTWVDEAVAVADSREGRAVRSRGKDMEVSAYDQVASVDMRSGKHWMRCFDQ
jgi:hypothetical protein